MAQAREWYRLTAKAGDEVAELSIFDAIGGGWFADEDAVTGKRFAAQLDALPESVKTIRVRVNSPGGAVFDALHIANALRRQSTEKHRTVEMLIEGLAASAATIVTSAGDLIRVPRNALMMIHMPSGLAMGPASAMRKTADALDRITDGIVATYRWVSPKSADELRALMEATTWMSAEEAVEHGFATEIVDPVEATASLTPEILAALGEIPPAYRAALDRLAPRAVIATATDTGAWSATLNVTNGHDSAIRIATHTPPPAAPTDVLAAVAEADLTVGFAHELLQAGLPMDQVRARIARATEIRALCATAKLPELADAYIRGGMPTDAVRQQLTTITAKLDRVEIDAALEPALGDVTASWARAIAKVQGTRKGAAR